MNREDPARGGASEAAQNASDEAGRHPIAESGAVHVFRYDACATVQVGTGGQANALTEGDWRALAGVFEDLSTERDLRAVVVAGYGGSTFSAGSDMREWLGSEPHAIDDSFAAMERALSAVEQLPLPTIARVNGAAVGAGCQLACACDLRIVASDAKLGMPVARWGILVPPSFAARLMLLTGPAVARELLLTGRLVDGEEAARVGLATASVPQVDLYARTAEVVASIAAQPPAAVRAAKAAVASVLAPARAHVDALPDGPSADYRTMQLTLGSFLTHTGAAR